MAYRSIKMQRTAQMMSILEDIINGYFGSGYDLKIKRQLTKMPEGDKELEGKELNKSEVTISAELMAECFQKMGILPKTKNPNEYVPGNFANEKSLKLNSGIKIGSEADVKFK